MKRIASLILAIILILGLGTDLLGAENEKSLLAYSEKLPPKVTDYAIEVFSRLHRYDMEAIGLTGWQVTDISLCPGINVADSVTEKWLEGLWCFPIKSMGKFSAVMFITQNDREELGFQLMQSKLSNDLNSLVSGTEFAVFLSGDRAYAGNYRNKKAQTVDLNSTIADEPDCYSQELGHKLLPVTTCGIKVYNGIGTCWASAAGSIVAYSKETISREAVEDYRDQIVEAKEEATGNKTGTLSDICRYINKFSSVVYDRHKERLTYDEIKLLIDNNSPAVIAYTTDDASYGHAAVLCGYSELSDMGESKYQAYIIVDPNHHDNQRIMISHTGQYTPAMMASDPTQYIYADYEWTATGYNTAYDIKKPISFDVEEPEGIKNIVLVVFAAIMTVSIIVFSFIRKPKKIGERYF